MGRKTRKSPRGPSHSVKEKSVIQHHHLLLRVELERCPGKAEKSRAEEIIRAIVRDLGMNLLAAPHVYYLEYPRFNEGLTAIAPIETSHIAFHFWTRPDRKILHNSRANCLLQFDVYTCGSLEIPQVKHVLRHLTGYGPQHADITLLNRNWGLTMDRHMKWDSADGASWGEWLESDRFNERM